MGVRAFIEESIQTVSRIARSSRKRPSYQISPVYDPHTGIPYTVSPSHVVPSNIQTPGYAATGEVPPHPWSVEIKTDRQIEAVTRACRTARKVMTLAKQIVNIGVTTEEIDARLHEAITSYGAYPSPLNYKGFPKSVCTSVNQVAVHGIPNSRPLEDGDIISVDISLFLGGVHGDLCETFLVGNVDEAGQRLTDTGRLCLDEAIKACGPGVRMSTIGNTISSLAKKHGYSVAGCCNGHGIGSVFHALPDVSHVANNRPGKMQPGMTFTIEPVLCEGSSKLYILEDEWTIITADGKRTAQFEETILIKEDGVEVLTQDKTKSSTTT